MTNKDQWAPLSNRALAAAVNGMDADAREYFEERAGIYQHEGDLPMDEAEALALKHTIALYPAKR